MSRFTSTSAATIWSRVKKMARVPSVETARSCAFAVWVGGLGAVETSRVWPPVRS